MHCAGGSEIAEANCLPSQVDCLRAPGAHRTCVSLNENTACSECEKQTPAAPTSPTKKIAGVARVVAINARHLILAAIPRLCRSGQWLGRGNKTANEEYSNEDNE